jgi:hypothetical protein
VNKITTQSFELVVTVESPAPDFHNTQPTPIVHVELKPMDPDFVVERQRAVDLKAKRDAEAAEAAKRALEATEAAAIEERRKLNEEAAELLDDVCKLVESIQAADFSRANSREVLDHYAGLHRQAIAAQRFVERHGLNSFDQEVVAMRRLVAPMVAKCGLRLS